MDIFDTLEKDKVNITEQLPTISNKPPKDIFDTINIPQPRDTTVQGAIVGIPSTAAVGYGLYKGGQAVKNWWQKPQKMVAPIETQLSSIQGQFPELAGTMQEELPSFIKSKIESKKFQKQGQLEDINFRTNKAHQILKQRVGELDNSMLSSNVSDLANTIKTGEPQFFKSASDSYGAGMDALDQYFTEKSGSFPAETFKKNVLENTLEKGRAIGIPENELRNIVKQTKNIKNLAFSDAKARVGNLIKQNPYGATSHFLREAWGNLLEQIAPKEVQPYITKLNQGYKPFAEVRNTLLKLSPSKYGKFNTEGLANYLLDYAKNKVDIGQKSLLKLLGAGNEVANPIPGVREKAILLDQLKTKRLNLQQAQQKMELSKQNFTRILSQKTREELNNLMAWKNKVDILLSQKAKIAEKFPHRLRGAGKTAKYLGTRLLERGIASKMFPIMGFSGQILDAYEFSQDPEAYTYRLETGQELAPKGSVVREIQLGRLI